MISWSYFPALDWTFDFKFDDTIEGRIGNSASKRDNMHLQVEQFGLTLLGAFTIMLVISFAVKPWAHAERIPILSL